MDNGSRALIYLYIRTYHTDKLQVKLLHEICCFDNGDFEFIKKSNESN